MQNPIIETNNDRSKKLEQYNSYVNKIWKIFLNRMIRFNNPTRHIFLNDMDNVAKNNLEDNIKQSINKKAKEFDTHFDINKYFKSGKCSFVPTKELPKKLVDNIFYDLFMNYGVTPNWKKLEKQLASFSNYLLYSNIDFKQFKNGLRGKDDDTVNILILGSGPTGLYIANYLNRINLLSGVSLSTISNFY